MNKELKQKLMITQRKIEQRILGATIRDRKTNQQIRHRTGVNDIGITSETDKWRLTGHLARSTDEKWTRITTNWRL